MANNDPLNSNKKDEEYQFTDDEFIEETSSASHKGLMSRILNRKVIAFIVIVIAVFVVYQFLPSNNPVKEEVKQAEQPIQTMVATTTETKPIVETPVVSEQDPVVILKQQADQQQLQITQLQQGVQQIQGTVTQLSQQVGTLSTAVDTLTKNAQKPKVVVTKPKQIVKLPVYYVRAVVPGRAWLIDANSQSYTVAVGDNLKGYGNITSISPTDGEVWTSSGRIIQPVPNN